LLYVKAPTAAGKNYLVVRDDQGGFSERTPYFSYWSLSDDVEWAARSAHFRGQLGVDTDLFVAVPRSMKWFQDSFTHTQCEGIVGARHRERYGKDFAEKQVVARVEGQPGQDFLVAILPRPAGEPPPKIDNWSGENGVRVEWPGEVHYVLLDTEARQVNADGVRAKTSCLVVKVQDRKNLTISLPAGGTASYAGRKLTATGPAGLQVVNGQATRVVGQDLKR
jgi:hypothetical protein